MSVAGGSRHLPVPAGLVSKSVSRRARWPAASGSWGMRQSQDTVLRTATALASARSVACGDARRLDRRLRCIPRMSHAVRIGIETWAISLGI
jgi:hypothetical protein